MDVMNDAPNDKDQNEKLSKEFLDSQISTGIVQKCPVGGCFVEKISGCNFIECPCGAKFCWNCRKEKGPSAEQCAYGNTPCNSH